MKKLNNKGFTLIEIVIVIVIIAILAAMLVPSLTSWIDKSKMKTFTSACGTIKTAVWSQAAESYAIDGTVSIDYDEVTNDVGKTVAAGTTYPSDNSYAVTVDYANDAITVYDANFKGVWDGAKWDVDKK